METVKCRGNSWNFFRTLFVVLEEFIICAMNNAKNKIANITRADICTKKYSNDKKNHRFIALNRVHYFFM